MSVDKGKSAIAKLPTVVDGPKVKLPTMKEMYEAAIDYFDDNFAWFLTHVLQLGDPVSDPKCPIAFIFWNTKTDRLEFHMNPNLVQLDVPSFSFLVAHECMHARLAHYEYLKLFGNKDRANIAADVVINDFLMSRGFEWPEEASGVNGENQLGYNTYIAGPLSVKEVYDLLPDDAGQNGQGGEGASCGMTSQEVLDAIKEALENGGTSPGQGDGSGQGLYQYGSGDKDLDDKIDEALGELGDEIKDMNNRQNNNKTPSGLTQGFGVDTELKKWTEDTGTKLAWAKLMFKVDPELFDKWGIGKPPRKDFHRRPRSLAAFPQLMLPVAAETRSKNEKYTDKIPHIVLALDSSGSCIHLIDKFITLARSIPKNRVDLWCCTFDTRFIEQTDLDEPKYTSGGTEFSVIEDFIQEKMRQTGRTKYPQAVVVITDGYARFDYAKPPDNQWNNWYWLLDGQEKTTDNYGIGKEHYYQLADYIE